MEPTQIGQEENNYTAFSKYLDKRKQFQNVVLKGMRQYQKNNRQNLKQIDRELFGMQNAPAIIDEYQMNQILSGIDRLKTLRYLTQFYGDLKEDIQNQLSDNYVNPLAQAAQVNDLELRFKVERLNRQKQEQRMDIAEKLNYNEKVMKQFINKENMADRNQKNKETQYELPYDEQLKVNQQEILERQANRDIQDQIEDSESKLNVQLLSKQAQAEELQEIKKLTQKFIQQQKQLQEEQKKNLEFLKEDLADKDNDFKLAYHQMVQNKLNMIPTDGKSMAYTHNINIIQMIELRCEQQQIKIERLEKEYKSICQNFNIESKFILSIDKNNQQQTSNQDNIQKKQKKISQEEITKQEFNQLFAEQSKRFEIKVELNENQKAAIIKRQQLERRQKFSSLLDTPKFNGLSVQEQMNIILTNENLSTEDKQILLNQLYNQKRGFLSKSDCLLIQNLILSSKEDFEKQILSEITLTSKYNRKKNNISQVMKILPSVEKIVVDSKFDKAPDNYMVEARQIDRKEQVDQFLSDWRIKEFLVLKGMYQNERQEKIIQTKLLIHELRKTIELFSNEENTKADYKQIGETLTSNLYNDLLDQSVKTSRSNKDSFFQSFNNKKKIQDFQKSLGKFEPLIGGNQRLTPFQRFYKEMQLNSEVRKNTMPQSHRLKVFENINTEY